MKKKIYLLLKAILFILMMTGCTITTINNIEKLTLDYNTDYISNYFISNFRRPIFHKSHNILLIIVNLYSLSNNKFIL